ncbi:hypothetical protein EVA_07366 [gut metagenome]|uniref:Uncharacterized protein n=1 Tax=gut metagenome TaxID=749906 RepID=J9GQ45_9ZZZZ
MQADACNVDLSKGLTVSTQMLAASSDLSYFMRCRMRRPFWEENSHPFCFVFATPGKERLTGYCN